VAKKLQEGRGGQVQSRNQGERILRGDSTPGSARKIQGSTTNMSSLRGVKDSRGRAGFMPRASVGLGVASHPSGA
jgi:hypothetical protein